MVKKLTPADIARKKMNAPFRVDLRSRIYDATTFINSGKWVRVKSSNVLAIRFEKPAQRFWVKFLNGAMYKYNSVTVELAKKFFRAVSYGRFVWFIRRSGYVGIKS